MNISQPVSSRISKVSFSFYDATEIKKMSVLQVTNPVMFDLMNHPSSFGLYDSRLGPHDKNTLCGTCSLDHACCPGHFGHIDLSVPCYSPVTFTTMLRILKATCVYCFKFRMNRINIALFSSKLLLLQRGLLVEASLLDSLVNIKQDEESAEVALTSQELILEKINNFTSDALQQNPKAQAKQTLITDAIKKLERQFLNSIPAATCQNCKAAAIKYRTEMQTKIFEKASSSKQKAIMLAKGFNRPLLFGENDDVEGDVFLGPIQVKKILDRLWDNDKVLLDLLYGKNVNGVKVSSPDMFFLTIVPVTPSKFRPVSKMGDMMFENPQNIQLVEILKQNLEIHDLQNMEKSWLEQNKELDSDQKTEKKREYLKKTIDAWLKLQESINFLFDSSKQPVRTVKVPPPGLRQILEKKEGLFRKHMMGKRVNYACRSVISPDPYIETNEIGIPPVFAKKLTYPEPVTPHNFSILRECVVNGPDQWPGATHVQNEDGSLIALSAFDEQGRAAIASQLLTPTVQKSHLANSYQFKHTNKKVYRHLRNGDFLLLNRQPTLHKPSIMAHTARILPGERTIRMHYANCNTYNADFDGDEMNAHFPQNEIARAEAMLIARNDMQYLVPTDGGVLRGLIQDHVDAGVHMCSRDKFFNREDYIQLVYAGLREASFTSQLGNGNIEKQVVIGDNGYIILQPPTIIKPRALWTGKQIISTILDNLTPAGVERLNLISKAKVAGKQWGKSALEEEKVLIMDGDLLTGILDKSQFGASANGLVHAVYEVYGPPFAGKLLSILGRLFTAYMQKFGFSCRMDDLLLTPKGDEIRTALIKDNAEMGTAVAQEFVDATQPLDLKLGLEKVLRNTEKMASLDSAMKQKTNKVTSEIINRCIPDHLYKPFPRNNMQVMTISGAKGSSVNVSQISCLLGQQELEGKRVPTMVSGKTLPSFKAFDPSSRAGGYITGRFLTGIKPQEYYFHCMAGREGLIDTAVKTSRSGYLQRCLIKGLEGIRVHYDNTVRDSDGSILQFRYGEDALDVCKQTTLRKFDFNALNYRALLQRYGPDGMFGKIDEETVPKFLKKRSKSQAQGQTVNEDPVLSLFEPSSHLGCVSDKFQELLTEYMDANPLCLIKQKDKNINQGWSGELISKRKFQTLMHLKYMHSLVEPGEAVGLLAAQSIGEPSTQMTLNTFHFAGFGAKNVTLGIPRLREIIMTASSSIKTPLMTLPINNGVSERDQELLCQSISKLVLSQIVENIKVTESLVPKKGPLSRQKLLKVCIEFWDQKYYAQQYNITKAELKTLIEKRFVMALERAIARDLKGSRERNSAQDNIGVGTKPLDAPVQRINGEDDQVPVQSKSKKGEAADASDSEPESDNEGDGDATEANLRSKKTQQSTYDEEAEEADSESEDDEDSGHMEVDKPQEEILLNDTRFVSGITFDKDGKFCELSIKFQADTKKILMVAICEAVLKKLVVHEVPGIERCFPQPNESENDKSVNLGTEGCNLRGMWEFQDKINVDKLYTNDISAILNTYGVEAARCAIKEEIASVFGVYGIDVDTRHLSLIADYMTFEGGYKPFNRIGMNSHTSPFAQMSYERTTHFLTSATLAGDYDSLDSPSARIVMGQVVKGGTGAFDVLQPLKKLEQPFYPS